MKLSSRIFIGVACGYFFVNSISAEETVIDSLNDHGFLSAVITTGNLRSIYHEVCNLTEEQSAFIWRKAGLGIDALDQLNPRLCARRTQKGIESLGRGQSEVSFQDGTTGDVDTIFQCHTFLTSDTCDQGAIGNAAARITELSIFMSDADQKNLHMETVTIGIRNLGGGLVEVFVESSDGIEHAAIIVNSADASVEEIREIIGGGTDLQIDTFGYFRETGQVEASFLTEEIKSSSPALMFRKPETGGMSHFYKLKDINRLGDLLSILILNEGRVVARADTPVPQD